MGMHSDPGALGHLGSGGNGDKRLGGCRQREERGKRRTEVLEGLRPGIGFVAAFAPI
jgi:hypothetical protein